MLQSGVSLDAPSDQCKTVIKKVLTSLANAQLIDAEAVFRQGITNIERGAVSDKGISEWVDKLVQLLKKPIERTKSQQISSSWVLNFCSSLLPVVPTRLADWLLTPPPARKAMSEDALSRLTGDIRAMKNALLALYPDNTPSFHKKVFQESFVKLENVLKLLCCVAESDGCTVQSAATQIADFSSCQSHVFARHQDRQTAQTDARIQCNGQEQRGQNTR